MQCRCKINKYCLCLLNSLSGWPWLPVRAELEKSLPPAPTLAAAWMCKKPKPDPVGNAASKNEVFWHGWVCRDPEGIQQQHCQSRQRCSGVWFPIVCLILSMSLATIIQTLKKYIYDSKNSSQYILLIRTNYFFECNYCNFIKWHNYH